MDKTTNSVSIENEINEIKTGAVFDISESETYTIEFEPEDDIEIEFEFED